MATILVDIQVLSLEEINERSEKCKRDIEVCLLKLLICLKPLIKEATYNEKLPELSRKQRDALKREKENSSEEVLLFFCKFSFLDGLAPLDFSRLGFAQLL